MKRLKRLLSLMLVLVTFVTMTIMPVSAANSFDGTTIDYRAWSQDQLPWGPEKLGGASEYGGMNYAGCLVVALAKLSVQLGSRTTSNINPSIANAALLAGGASSSTGSISSYTKAAKALGLTYVGQINYSDILTYLKKTDKTYGVILKVGGKSHYVVVDRETSLSKGTVYIHDSYTQSTNKLSTNKNTVTSSYSTHYSSASSYKQQLIGIKYTSRYTTSGVYAYAFAYGSSSGSTSTTTPKLTWTDYSSKPTTIYNTDALLSKTLSVSNCSISDVTKVGIEIWNGTATTKLDGKTETPTPKNGIINMYYTVNDELGYTLTKNTKYQYRFLAVINGTTYYSPYYSFVTGPNQGYTVSFNANGGSCSTSSIKVANGATYGTLPTPTRTNYNFTGWYTTSSGGSKITSSTTATLSANQTLYAHWTHVCANGHTYNSGTVTKQPTATSTGVKTYTCTVCGATKTESIPATGIETTPMYRMYNPNSGEHFYTGSVEEKNNLMKAGWNYEGIAWYAPTKSGEPVYRAYNPNSGDHHYTMSWTEIQNLKNAGWNYEGIAWNSAPADQVPQYRLYNPNAICGSHHYTSSPVEKQNLLNLGWIYEGIGWYGYTK